MSVRYSPEARADLREALEYLTERNSRAAAQLQSGVERLIGQLDAREFEGPDTRRAGRSRGVVGDAGVRII